MSNTLAPFGFAESNRLGAAPNYQMATPNIATTNSTAIYQNDPVQWATGTTGLGTGYIKQATSLLSWTVTGTSWSAGTLTVTASGATVAPAVGSSVILSGFASGSAGANGGPYTVLTATTTSFTISFPSTLSTDTGTATFYQPVAGIFVGCEYMSSSLKRRVYLNYWPGNTSDIPANTTITAKVINDPEVVFRVQGNGQITQAMVGLNATFAIGTGSTVNGISGASLDTVTTAPAAGSSYLPFRIIGLIDAPPGGPGTDTTSAYNWCYVAFNNQDFNALNAV
jgi:hypothetical protein